MSTVVRAVGLAFVTSLLAPAAQPRAQVFRSGVQTVFVDVSVQRDNRPLANLSVADFTLTDRGVPQRIESLAGAAIPLDVSLVVDASWSTLGLAGGLGPAGTDILHRNARQVTELLGPDDRLGAITYAADVIETRPMSPAGAPSERISLANPQTYSLNNRYRITQALLTALAAHVAPDRRHVVLLFAAARGDPELPSLEHLVRAATRADVLLYAVLTPRMQEPQTRRPFEFFPSEVFIRDAVTRAAEATGGKAYLTGDIVGAFRDVLKEFRQSYVLRYTLEGVPSAGWHEIVVKVPSCPTCTIRARRGYLGK